MAVTIREIGQTTNPKDLIPILRDLLNDLEDQLNQRAQVYTFTDGKIPARFEKGDLIVSGFKGNLSISLQTGQGFLRLIAAMLGGLMSNSCNFLGIIRVTTASPSLTDFPNPGDFGFWFKTNATIAYAFCANIDGVLIKVTMAP